MRDRGVVCEGVHEGRRVLGLRVTWAKRYITLAPVATLLGLAFKAEDPDHLLGEQEELGITLRAHPDANAAACRSGAATCRRCRRSRTARPRAPMSSCRWTG